MADTSNLALAQVIRGWELPLAIEHEHAAVEATAELGAAQGLRPDDFALVLEEATERWQLNRTVGSLLRLAVDEALRFTPPVLDKIDAGAYFELYKKLRDGAGDVAGLPHSVARRLLSRTSLIAHLLDEEQFSCSQVARLLATTEASLDVSHGSVAFIARKLSLLPKLDEDAAGQDLWDSDQALSLALFPDSSVAETSAIAGKETDTWLPEVDVERLLNRLSGADQGSTEPNWPYLQMLHWCLTPIEFYDHPASYLYEFSPRGQIALELFARYPAATGNPVLNNAKAVQTLNSTWARNRGRADAHALVALLSTIESLPFVPRRQVARVLRAWLLRMIELRTVKPVLLDLTVTDDLFTTVTDYITKHETYTQGVIEQRVVDCLAVLAFDRAGWRARGLGDGVNASNLSRHKLGDVEFANVDERRAIALEAHGGHLSVTYVTDHTRSLKRIVEQRLAESWAALDDPEAWTVEVLFVAHSKDAAGLPTAQTLHGVNVTYEYIDYRELVERAVSGSTPPDRIAAFGLHVIEQLNAGTVRESVREKFREITAAPAISDLIPQVSS
ncbi:MULTISPECIES: hypothetical protein [Rhodococcus]|nr:hypothetical protein [Rhodococcus pyridinivorans]MCD2118329.1 hypothetical protein [Rhodococcus pyridinivorans]MCZ4627244.1 hypothetical protein [Rhodococcus pyridinivorans]MCZ4648436.1 hypothetical protein [Rhodococcus pyridinivorans]MDJ0481129.1 hypothetical protein [Rhodococcus pyridinivorans]MDV7254595.1 hypothetical protein [Rhodococcus pyridinivorans]